jgi:hypothetical protein
MPTAFSYRAKLIIERVEATRAARIGSTPATKEAVFDEMRVEIKAPNADVALSKLINIALAEQGDRDSRALMPNETEHPLPDPASTVAPFTSIDPDEDQDDEEDEDED